MKIIISPAKTIDEKADFDYIKTKPKYLSKAKELYDYLLTLDKKELKAIYGASDKIIDKAYHDLRRYDITKGHISALFGYDGIQYKAMAPSILDDEALRYLDEHLLIVSGLYGILHPFDQIIPYRLEMGQKLLGYKQEDLYAYWNDLYKEIGNDLLIDLASNEYSKAIVPHLKKDSVVTIVFLNDDKVKATYAKKARGAFVRYLSINKITEVKDMVNFKDLNYHIDRERSDDHTLYFIGD